MPPRAGDAAVAFLDPPTEGESVALAAPDAEPAPSPCVILYRSTALLYASIKALSSQASWPLSPSSRGGTYAYPSRSRPRRDALIAAAGSRSCLRAGRCEVARTSRERKPRAAIDAVGFGARTSGACVDDS